MFHDLNDKASRRFPYYFDTRIVRQDEPQHHTFRRVLVFVCIGFLCLSWIPIERTYRLGHRETHALEKARLDQDVRERYRVVNRFYKFISYYDTGLKKTTQWQLAGLIYDLGQEYNMDPYLILGVIKTESFFHNRAVSHAGAEGLMQILPRVGEELAEELHIPYTFGKTLFEPLINVRLGTHFLANLTDRFHGNIELALIAYNRGPWDVKRTMRRGEEPPPEYANRVLEHYHAFAQNHDPEQARVRRRGKTQVGEFLAQLTR